MSDLDKPLQAKPAELRILRDQATIHDRLQGRCGEEATTGAGEGQDVNGQPATNNSSANRLLRQHPMAFALGVMGYIRYRALGPILGQLLSRETAIPDVATHYETRGFRLVERFTIDLCEVLVLELRDLANTHPGE